MSNDPEYIVFHVLSNSHLKESEKLSLLFRSLGDKDFYYFEDYEDFFNRKLVEHSKVLESAEQKRQLAEREGHPFYELHFWKEQLALVISFHIKSYGLFIATVMNGDISNRSESDYQNLSHLIEFCSIAYTVFQPDYGYGLLRPETYQYEFMTNSSDLIQSMPDAIFDFNFFGPRLVMKIGEDMLLRCPSWRTSKFSDGGILLNLSPNPIADWESYQENYKGTAAILGVAKIVQGG